MGGQELTWYINRAKIVIVDILRCLNTLLKTVKDVTMSVGMVLKASFWYFYYNSGGVLSRAHRNKLYTV